MIVTIELIRAEALECGERAWLAEVDGADSGGSVRILRNHEVAAGQETLDDRDDDHQRHGQQDS